MDGCVEEEGSVYGVRVGEWRAGSIVQWGKKCGTRTHTNSYGLPLSKALISFIACTVQLVSNTQPISNPKLHL